MPKVSVIVPAYNVEPYLKECLDSIINQTLKDLEIICINDGSTDNTLSILKQYADKDARIKIISKENSGYGHTMNVGLSNASGEYIGIVEPDDYIASNMYETLHNTAKKNDLDIIKSDFHRFTGKGQSLKLSYVKIADDNSYYNTVFKPIDDIKTFKFVMNTVNAIYKRTFLNDNNIRYNETPGASFQDNGFWFQTFVFAEKVYLLNSPFYMVRRDNPNSSVKSKGKVYAVSDEFKYIYSFLEKNPKIKKRTLAAYTFKKYRSYMFTLDRIDQSLKKEFIKHFSKEFKEAKLRGEIDKNFFSKDEWKNVKLIINNHKKFYRKHTGRLSFFEKLLSVTNKGNYKTLRILGIKIKFRNKHKELLSQVSELSKKITLTQNENKALKESVDRLSRTSANALLNENKVLKESIDRLSKTSLNVLLPVEKLIKQIDLRSREIIYADLLHDSTFDSMWLKNKTFTPVKSAANYSFLYILFKILDEINPERILEMGLGQTSKMTTQFANHFKAHLDIIEHDSKWINIYKKRLSPSEYVNIHNLPLAEFDVDGIKNDKYDNLKDVVKDTKYNLIIVDGPIGYGKNFPRTNIVDLISGNLSENFVILLDDAQRQGEKNTAELIFKKLADEKINFNKTYITSSQSQLVIASTKNEFILNF